MIECPKCKRLNKEELERCIYCQSQLREEDNTSLSNDFSIFGAISDVSSATVDTIADIASAAVDIISDVSDSSWGSDGGDFSGGGADGDW